VAVAARSVEGVRHPGVDPVGGGGGGRHLLGQHQQVVDEDLVDERVGRLDPDGPPPGPDDGPVGHPVEANGPARVAPAEGALEGDLQGASTDAPGGDEGAIDVEEENGGSHVQGWAWASDAWSRSRTPGSSSRSNRSSSDLRAAAPPARPRPRAAAERPEGS